jgi:pyruvate/2-oxoglutarate dehydrogenase complex dihydrolipoamide dehydrogenase (E3) component
MKTFEYDLVALGGGTAGLVSAAGASYLGIRAGLIEKTALGGDCLWTGCIPSKALIASARLAHTMRSAEEWGLKGAAPGHVFADVMARMRRVRGEVAHHDDPERFRKMGVDIHFGGARFLGPGTLEVEGVGRIRSKRIVIATGAVPAVPPIPGLADAGYLTHMTAFDEESLPDSIVILGGGPIGLEFAQVYRRLGAEVTVVEMLPGLLTREDPDVASALQEILEEEGIRFRLGARGTSVRTDGGLKVLSLEDGSEVAGHEIFVAAGRRPHTEGLGLELAGVERVGHAIKVDRKLQTTGAGVWAAGDVTGGLQFTHVADYMAKAVLQNSIFPVKKRVDYGNIPRVTYTDPEVAQVGLTQEEGEARGGTTHSYPFNDLDRAMVDGETKGFVKVTADKKGRILGATILGHGAGELIMPLVLAKTHGLTIGKISGTVFPYPTRAEGVKRAVDAFQRDRLEGTSGKILKKVVSWLR